MQFLNKYRKALLYFFIPVLSVLLHWNIFHRDLVGVHVWRQCITQTYTENFYQKDFCIFKPRMNAPKEDNIYRMEFPLIHWIVALFYKIFGSDIFISRLLYFLCGILSIWGIFHLIRQINGNNTMALLGAWSLSFSPLFFYYTINPMPDNAALCFSIWGMFFFFKHLKSQKISDFFISNLLLSLAALSKLPYVVFYSPILLYLFQILSKKTQGPKALWQMILISLLLFSPNIIWYSFSMEFLNKNVVFTGILGNFPDLQNLVKYLTGTLISIFPELLINYAALLFFFSGIYFIYKRKKKHHPYFRYFLSTVLMIILYYLYEINTIELSHDYYLMPFLPVLIILIAYGSFTMLSKKKLLVKLLTFILLLLIPLAAYLRIIPRWDTNNPGFNKDILIYKNDLRNAIPDHGLCLAGHENTSLVFLFYLNKSGLVFDENTFSKDFFLKAMETGIEYCYSDSRSVDDSIRNYHAIDSIIDTFGSVVVYKLKKYPHAD